MSYEQSLRRMASEGKRDRIASPKIMLYLAFDKVHHGVFVGEKL